jgi:predicted ATPase
MIKTFHVTGFKALENQIIELTALNLLAGSNGAGKTSLIHALLLLREASKSGEETLVLNGPYGLELGTLENIQNWKNPEISLAVTDDESRQFNIKLGGEPEARYAKVLQRQGQTPHNLEHKARVFQYLCAERYGPRAILPVSSKPPHEIEVGVQGEYCAHVLNILGGTPVPISRVLPGGKSDQPLLVKFQTERWLSRITREVQIDTEPAANATTGLKFRFEDGDWVTSTNMGFGITYALPIIVAGLTAAPDGLLVIENPEAHLHPSGQSSMGGFLATIAASGVQVIVETHSDHVINGIRRAVGEMQILRSDQTSIYAFEQGSSELKPLQVTPTGGISDWPVGFFDQYQTDISVLSRIRRR